MTDQQPEIAEAWRALTERERRLNETVNRRTAQLDERATRVEQMSADLAQRAASVEEAEAVEHIWSMVRTKMQMERVIHGIEANPGVVLFTLVDEGLRAVLQEGCRKLQMAAIPVLDPVLAVLASQLGRKSRGLPGQQHLLDSDYFRRIDAMTFALAHDDGQSAWGLKDADVVLVGVSRTSKTPTCMYLANRGIKAANVPIVPGTPLPNELFSLSGPLVVGLTPKP